MRLRFAVSLGLLALCQCKSPPPVDKPGPAPSAATAQASASAAPSASATPPAASARAHTQPYKAIARAGADVAVAGGADADGSSKPAVTPASVGLPTVDFGPPGPVVLKGYPDGPIGNGMSDPATALGYSKDGSELVACGDMVGGFSEGAPKGSELGTLCYVAGRTGPTRSFAAEEKGLSPQYVAAVTSLKSGSMVRLTPTTTPPAVAATWGFAKDITIEVTKGSALKIGGRVGAEEPVYPVTLSVKPPHPDMQYDGTWNAILPSPEKTELGFVGHFFCMEWCNDLVIARLPFGKLASLVFNDTGFRHHQKKDYQVSRELFLKATWANPTAPLPPYNLACAYALTNDATNAEKALKLAIAVGGPKVKARAVKDPDFKAVVTAKWFVELTK